MNKLFYILLLFLGQEVLAQSPIKVACVGNSITQGPGRENPDSYPLQMQKKLGKKYEVVNFGVSGRTLLKKGDHPYWEEPQFEAVKNFAPDILIIKLGTNDSKPQNWKFKDEFLEDYVEMIEVYKASMPKTGKIYVCLPVPVFKTNFGITEEIIVNEMAPLIRQAAEKTGTILLDLHQPMEKHGELFADGVHPNKKGNKIMAKIVAKAIR
ncbi:GDSL-type esterase/lipase family protein [uncultured Cyclobacterium sp.]|uniref:GDSL-type esterase/lipase family protein n=1 Tax=uncultured Cyclobacterium sp. TaxID=453820 RepID=UPI0030EC3195|tara:strand:+ start:76008 stop:76637 length:630 start_codon:yes stop_codon:yes gene_type:complete